MSVIVTTKPFVDTVELLYRILHPKLYKFLWSQTYALKEHEGDLVPNGSILATSDGPYLRRVKFYFAAKRNIADIEVGATHAQIKFIKVRLFPQTWHVDEFAWFQQILAMFFDISYSQMYSEARVTRVDIAHDLLFIRREDVIPFRPYSSVSAIYKDKGKLGTAYVGSRHSDFFFRVYDKAAQYKGPNSKGEIWTRVEAEVRRTNLTTATLSALKNPLSNFGLANRSLAFKTWTEPLWHQFLCVCVYEGAPHALRSLDKPTRALFRQRLKKCAIWGWNPEFSWKLWPQAIALLAPT